MSEAYQFAIGRARALILAACFAAAALLLFFAGTLTGILYSNRHETSAKVTVPDSAVKVSNAPEVKAPELASPATPAVATPPVSDTAKATPQTIPPATATSAAAPTASPVPAPTTAPAATTAANVPPAAGTSAAIATPPTSASATATTAKPPTNDKTSATPVEASYAIPLVVRVGSFSIKANAESLMQSLKDMGYQPAMSLHTDSKGRDWYAVKVGPYTRWNIASQVAARISIAENVTPVIGPMQ